MSQRHKHVATRMCIVCRTKGDKRQLTRLVNMDGGVVVDPSSKMAGRGAYLCDDRACWDRAVSSDMLAKALRVSINDDDRMRIRQYLS